MLRLASTALLAGLLSPAVASAAPTLAARRAALASDAVTANAIIGQAQFGGSLQAYTNSVSAGGFPTNGSANLIVSGGDAEAVVPGITATKRWVVERNSTRDERPRRMNRDHDRLLSVSEAWIWLLQGRMLMPPLVATV